MGSALGGVGEVLESDDVTAWQDYLPDPLVDVMILRTLVRVLDPVAPATHNVLAKGA